MRRILAIFGHLFSGHVFMQLCVALGTISLAAALIAGLAADEWDLAWAALMLFMPPVMLAPVAFRQLVGNRQMALVPGLRTAAGAALLLVPVTAGLASGAIFVLAGSGPGRPAAPGVALGSFALVSGYLLLWQWLCTFTAGTFLHLALIFFVLYTGFNDPAVFLAAMHEPWPLAGLAAAAWVWLWAALHGSTQLAPPARGLDAWSSPSHPFDRQSEWLPRASRSIDPVGTLIRGAGAGLIHRVGNVLILFAGAGGVAFAWFFLVMPDNANPAVTNPALLFLWISFLSAANFAPLAISEWPLRLRYLWLRAPGDRDRLWHRLERELAGDMSIVTVVAALIALGMLVFTDIAPIYLIAYIGGCALGSLWSCYFGFWLRLTGSGFMLLSTVLVFCWALAFAIVTFMYRQFPPGALLWLLPVFAGLALHSRFRAREAFIRHDWCALRPARRAAQEKGVRHNF